jgi:hypothetical protein
MTPLTLRRSWYDTPYMTPPCMTPLTLYDTRCHAPPKVRHVVDLSKSAGKPSGLVPEFRSMQKVPRMDNDRPTYHIIKTNNSIPGRESVQGLLYSGDDDDRFPGVAGSAGFGGDTRVALARARRYRGARVRAR